MTFMRRVLDSCSASRFVRLARRALADLPMQLDVAQPEPVTALLDTTAVGDLATPHRNRARSRRRRLLQRRSRPRRPCRPDGSGASPPAPSTAAATGHAAPPPPGPTAATSHRVAAARASGLPLHRLEVPGPSSSRRRRAPCRWKGSRRRHPPLPLRPPATPPRVDPGTGRPGWWASSLC